MKFKHIQEMGQHSETYNAFIKMNKRIESLVQSHMSNPRAKGIAIKAYKEWKAAVEAVGTVQDADTQIISKLLTKGASIIQYYGLE